MSEKIGAVDGDRLGKLVKKGENRFIKDGFEFIACDHLLDLIDSCRLPIQPPERIEAAIRYFNGATAKLSIQETIDLCKYFAGHLQSTWSDSDFGPSPSEEEQKGGKDEAV